MEVQALDLTLITVSAGRIISKTGKKVLIVDGDFGLSNVSLQASGKGLCQS